MLIGHLIGDLYTLYLSPPRLHAFLVLMLAPTDVQLVSPRQPRLP